MKISPNYECKRGITRKLVINKRLLRSIQAAKSPQRHRSDSSIGHKKGSPTPFPDVEKAAGKS